jgi:predicted short-subunit dehydrogenase-like oxidoreductase (DUF2520 family)
LGGALLDCHANNIRQRGSSHPGAASAILPAVPQKSPPVRRPTVSIVGPGNLGSALALTLASAGYPVKFLVVRPGGTGGRHAKALAKRTQAQLVMLGEQSLDTDIVWLTVPDDSIAEISRALAASQDWKGKFVFHSSGALTSAELASLRKQGARVASAHPMMTFVRGGAPEMAGVSFALEGDAAAVRMARSIVKDLGANPFVVKKQNKVLYHVFGSFASPLVIALMATMEQVAAAGGIRKQDIKAVMVPLLWQTLRNYLQKDAGAAFSGPLVRGDVATVRKHLSELKKLPEAREVYVALAKASLKSLPVGNRKAIERELR